MASWRTVNWAGAWAGSNPTGPSVTRTVTMQLLNVAYLQGIDPRFGAVKREEAKTRSFAQPALAGFVFSILLVKAGPW